MRWLATALLAGLGFAVPAAALAYPAVRLTTGPSTEPSDLEATADPAANAANAAKEADSDKEHAGEGHAAPTHHSGEAGHGSRLSDEAIPLQLDGFPERPDFLIELGNPYLGTGRIKPGLELPTGAVWQPTLIVFGTLRSAVQTFESSGPRITEWANRLDLFANLQLSGTERLVVGFRNFDQEGRFSGYVFSPDPDDPFFLARFGDDDRFREELNADIQSFFFEGDFGEIFPNLDKQDFGRRDVGFSLGRQPLFFQEGMLISDSIDGLGLTRNTLLPKNTSNFRVTFFVGVDNIDRANVEDDDANLYAVLTSVDRRKSTWDIDLAYVDGAEATGDMAAIGVSAVQRIGQINTSFRLLASSAIDDETAFATDGALAMAEVSWTPHHTHDLFYFTAFAAVDEFSSAARGPATGGPLGRAGINFAATGIGSAGAALSSRAREVAGGAVGYQKFFGAAARRQFLAELGLRVGLEDDVADAGAVTFRFQQALGQHVVLVADAFGGRRRALLGQGDDETLSGGRFEVVLKF